MSRSEYSSFGIGRTCGCCGAGVHNDYRHDENCLINVPVAFAQYWREGSKASTGQQVISEFDESTQEGRFFRMGMPQP